MQRLVALIVLAACYRVSFGELALVQKRSHFAASRSTTPKPTSSPTTPATPSSPTTLAPTSSPTLTPTSSPTTPQNNSVCTANCVENCCQHCSFAQGVTYNGGNMTVTVNFSKCKSSGTISWAAAKLGINSFASKVDTFSPSELQSFNVPAGNSLIIQIHDGTFRITDGPSNMCLGNPNGGYGSANYWAGGCNGGCSSSISAACEANLTIPTTTATTTTTTTSAPTPSPAPEPTPSPTPSPTPAPTSAPTPSPTPEPTPSPTPSPTPEPSPAPTTTTTTSCESASCSIYNDPHVSGFDNAEDEGPASLEGVMVLQSQSSGFDGNPFYFGSGDVWLVKSDLVQIQGHYVNSTLFKTGGAVVGAIAIGGAILDGKILLVEPRTGNVRFNGEQIVFGLSEIELSNGKMRVVNSESEYGRERPFTKVGLHLPMNTELTINRYDEYLNVKITMAKGSGHIDGQCGNFNGDEEDDSSARIERRMGSSVVLPEDSFFEHE